MRATFVPRLALLAALLLVATAGISLARPAQQAPLQDKTDPSASAKSKKPQQEPNAAAQGSANSPAAPTSASGAAGPSKPAARQNSPANNQMTVWVNTETGVYHKPGSRWYGKTKKGKYMSEADAKKAGYRETKKKE